MAPDVPSEKELAEFYVDNLGRYRQTGVLGAGTFGVVIKAIDESGAVPQEVAIKLLPRGEFIGNFKTYVQREIIHQGSLTHPFIVALKEVLLTPTHLAIVMEYARGGNLLAYTVKHFPAPQQEEHARWIFQQLVVGLDYCHRMGVANRDLKLENLLVDQDTSSRRPLLKICDFGYSKHEQNSSANSKVGTPIFMAPEIVFSGRRYDAKKADIWSCGVILYAQIYGRYPFDSKARDYARRFHAADYELPAEVAASAAVKDLIRRLLVADPAERAGMEEILGHAWFQQALPTGALQMNEYYLAKAPRISDEHKFRLEVLVTQASQPGAPGDAIQRLSFSRRAA